MGKKSLWTSDTVTEYTESLKKDKLAIIVLITDNNVLIIDKNILIKGKIVSSVISIPNILIY